MAILHVLVPAVLVFIGQSTACVEWMILNPPIIFGKTAQLLCSPGTRKISSNAHNVTSWLGGKHCSTLATNGGTADPRKYAEIRRLHRSKFESILQIYKFDEMDVNVNYSCSIGGCENRKSLSLTPDMFEYHPDKDTTRVLTSFRNGYLDVIVKIKKVYPKPKCIIMFNENIISRQLTTKTSVNGIFYMVVVEVDQLYVDVCSGQLIVTCVVGKTEIPIYQETFNRCTKTKKESPEDISYSDMSIIIVLLVFTILAMVVACITRYIHSKNVICCRQSRGKEERTSEGSVSKVVNKLTMQGKEGSTHDAGREESHEMILSEPDAGYSRKKRRPY